MKIHVEIYLAAHMLERAKGTFAPSELVDRVRKEFGDHRPGVKTHAHAHCVANAPLNTGYINNYLWRITDGVYRCFDPMQDTPHPDRIGGRHQPDWQDVPPEYRWLLEPSSSPPSKTFEPVSTFAWKINRAERCVQVRLLVPLLARSQGRAWFLEQLRCPCTPDEARDAQVLHLCFPLRDIFTDDYCQCRGKSDLEDQFIAYYNRLFGLPEDFGVSEIWRTAPGGEIRHPAAGGRSGWYDDFLRERIRDQKRYTQTRNVRRMLGTEADCLLLTEHHVVLVECKYMGQVSAEQYERQQMMGPVLARRLDKDYHFGMVVETPRDVRYARIDAPYVLWSQIEAWQKENVL
ncbi:MAG: hypothetical protein ISS56_18140 [Anaerolineae bacterium]|nr:hypothetical protein [Anaerolineae bacterium]